MTLRLAKLALLLLSIFTAFLPEVSSQCAGPIGTNNEQSFPTITSSRFYLNTAAPAPCNGTITSWRYCYYKSGGINSDRDYYATVAVYRQMSNAQHERVSNMVTIFLTGTQINAVNGDFVCTTLDTPDFDIEAGDVVGACVFNPAGARARRLELVGRASDYSLMRMDAGGCSLTTIPSTISSNDLSNVDSRILHLYANITNTPTFPSTTTVSPNEQTTLMTLASPTTTAETTFVSDIPTSPPTTTVSPTEQTTLMTLASPTTTAETTFVSDVPTFPPTTTVSPNEQTTLMILASPTTTAESTFVSDITTSPPTTTVSPNEQTTLMILVLPTTTAESTFVSDIPTSPPTTMVSPNEQTTLMTLASPTTPAESTSVSSGIENTDVARVDANNNGGAGVVAGVVVLILALLIAGVIATIILVIFFKRRAKNGGHNLQSEQTRENCLNIYTYDTGFTNPLSVDAECSIYDEITVPGPQSAKTGKGHYSEPAETRFTNTYECVGTAIDSRLAEQVTHKLESRGELSVTEGNFYDLENFYSSPDEPQTSLSYLLERNKQEDIYDNLDAYYAPASEEDEIYSQLQTCGVMNISHSQIKISSHLGSGQFGNVEKGTWQSKVELEVALKTLKTDSTHEDKVKFLQEAAIMAQFKHPNIVTLHGVVSDKEPVMLVVELIHRGDLRDYLHTMRPDPGELLATDLPDMLLNFSQQVALGMHYLSSKGFVHRDLAARNILVSKDNICKVADFGMSRDLADENYYVSHGGKIPVKWTAPEAIHYKKYSTASDVWSYGCLLYEIWSLGYKPFEDVTNIEVVRLVDSNKRLSPPPGCTRLIYELMIKCWNPVASSRPGFRQITIILTGDQSVVLSIPLDDRGLCTHKLAGVLGAPIEAAKSMYIDLQNKYISESSFYD